MQNFLKEKEVLKILFQRYENILDKKTIPILIEDIPEKCSSTHLKKLTNEAILNISKYPHDKLYRWLGFTRSVIDILTENSPGQKTIISNSRPIAFIMQYEINKSILKECFKYESDILYSAKITEKNIKWPLNENKKSILNYIREISEKDSIDNLPNEVLHFHLGFIQGLLSISGIINVDEEREYTRPLLHSYHDIKPESF